MVGGRRQAGMNARGTYVLAGRVAGEEVHSAGDVPIAVREALVGGRAHGEGVGLLGGHGADEAEQGEDAHHGCG